MAKIQPTSNAEVRGAKTRMKMTFILVSNFMTTACSSSAYRNNGDTNFLHLSEYRLNSTETLLMACCSLLKYQLPVNQCACSCIC